MADLDSSMYSRPDYPPATVKLIMDFHRAHSNSLRLAHCIGVTPKSMTFIKTLADYFQHIHISDPSPDKIARVRAELSQWYEQNWWKAKFSFSANRPEEADLPFVEHSVDFWCSMDPAWRTDLDMTTKAVGESLAPNGTLVVVQVGPACKVVGNATIDETVEKLFRAVGEQMLREADGGDMQEVEQRNAGLDHVPLPDPDFIQDVTKRIKINVKGRGHAPFAIPGQGHLTASSKVEPLHRKYEYAGPDPEAEGWTQAVDAGWFRGYIKSMCSRRDLERFEEHVREVQRAIRADEKVVVDWAVSILLATKK